MKRWILSAILIMAAALGGCDSSSTGTRPGPSTPNPAGLLYVANQTDSTIYVYDTRTLTRIDSFPAGINQPHYIEFSHDLQHYYIVSRDFSGRLAKFDATADTLIGTVTLPGLFPTSLAISDDNVFGYICDFSAPSEATRIYKYNLETLTPVDSMGAGASTHAAEITSDGKIVLATNMSDIITMVYTDVDSVFQVDIDPDSTYALTRRKFGPYGITIDHKDSLAYIACLHHHDVHAQVRVLDIAQRRIVDSIYMPVNFDHVASPAGPTLLTLSPDDRFLFVTTQWDNSIIVVRLDTRTVREIPVEVGRTFGLTISDDGSRVYVCAANVQGLPGRVYILDGNSHDLIDSLEVGRNPYGLSWRPL